MKTYVKSWKNQIEDKPEKKWSQFSTPMSLKVNEDVNSKLFITASLEFSGIQKRKLEQNHRGSVFYKILVDDQKVNEYHVIDSTNFDNPLDVNLQCSSIIPAGEHTIEVCYKLSKDSSWTFLGNQNQRQLSVLSFPQEQ